MSDTKPVTLHDGTPVPQKWCAWWQCLCAGGDSLSRREVALKYAIEELARAEAREKRLRDALEAIKYALSDERPLGVPGWKPARDYLDARDIYNDDLNDLRVLFEVARAALTDK